METEFEQFFQLLQQFRRIRWGSNLKEMTQAEYIALAHILHAQEARPEQPGVYVSALAEHLMISVSMVSKMLKVLEEKGWILRTIDPNSRRNTFVSLTDLGRRLYAEESARTAEVNRRVMARMGEECMARFLKDAENLAECYAQELGTT